jgi:hypothetical protein
MLLVSTLAASCASTSKNLPPIAAEAEQISFSTTVGRLPCGDSLELMDRRVIEPMSELEQRLGPAEKITYYSAWATAATTWAGNLANCSWASPMRSCGPSIAWAPTRDSFTR